MFKRLISVSGVGPKAAISILTQLSPAELGSAVISGDYKLLTKAPGIGKKIAERILLELKDKIAGESFSLSGNTGNLLPVSYTHLDVYKRQHQSNSDKQ